MKNFFTFLLLFFGLIIGSSNVYGQNFLTNSCFDGSTNPPTDWNHPSGNTTTLTSGHPGGDAIGGDHGSALAYDFDAAGVTFTDDLCYTVCFLSKELLF